MDEDPRVYTEEEMALILRQATAFAESPSAEVGSSAGLTLDQIMAIAAEVGIDPAQVRRAARPVPRAGHESIIARMVGGPSRHERLAHLQADLTEERAARVLASVRAVVDHPGEGHADAFGVSWQSWSGPNRITVSVLPKDTGTTVRIRIDRTRALFRTVFWSQVAVVMSIWMLIENVDSYTGLLALGVIPAGVLALARALWVSSTRKAREQAGALLTAVAESLEDSTGG